MEIPDASNAPFTKSVETHTRTNTHTHTREWARYKETLGSVYTVELSVLGPYERSLLLYSY